MSEQPIFPIPTPQNQENSSDKSAPHSEVPQGTNPLDSDTPDANAKTDSSKAPDEKTPERLDAIAKKLIEVTHEVANFRQAAAPYQGSHFYLNVGGNQFTGETNVGGHIIGRDHHAPATHRAGARFSEGRVSIDIEKVRHVFVETDNYMQARRIVESQQLLILWGRPRWGKWTAAIHMLDALHPANEVMEIRPDAEDILTVEWAENQGYVIDAVSLRNAENLDAHVLKRISQELRSKKSHLVIVVKSCEWLSHETSLFYDLHWDDLPSHEKLWETHLSWHTQQKNLVHDLDASRLAYARKLLGYQPLPSKIDGLIAEVVQAAERGDEPGQAVEHFIAQYAHGSVIEWFEAHPDLKQRAFMVALAALSGCSHEAVARASKQLEELAKISPGADETALAKTAFDIKISEWVREFHAHLEQGFENTEFGQSSIETIVFDNDAFQPAVLFYVWHEYSDLREPLLEWLYELGMDGNANVRFRAAAAVGELSKYAFGMTHDVIARWAKYTDPLGRVQNLVAIALSICITVENVANQVLKLLNHWRKLDNPHLKWIATLSYGGIGLHRRKEALEALNEIVQSGAIYLLAAISESLTLLFAEGQHNPDYFHDVLQLINEWTQHPRKSERHRLLVFLPIMRVKHESDSMKGKCPALLLFSGKERANEDLVLNLLRRSLNWDVTRSYVLEEIYVWVEFTDHNPGAFRSLGRLIWRLVLKGSPRETDRICEHLNRWATNGKSNTANRLLAMLKEHSLA